MEGLLKLPVYIGHANIKNVFREHQDKKCSLRKQYDLFLAEDQKRKERNAQILQKLDNITQKANQLQYRADRVKSLKWRDQSPPRLLPDHTLRISPLPYGLAAPYTPPRIPPYYYEPQKQDLLKPEHSIPNPNIPPQVPVFYPMQCPNFVYPQPPQYVNNLTIDDIVKEISKKYILIPRRTTENLNKEDAHELHPNNRRNEESDVSWRDKYDILDKLHNNEDVATNGKRIANNDNKSPTHELAGSSKVNLNEIKITLNDFEDWQNRLHGKDRKNDIERVNLSTENDKSLREVYFADDISNFKIQPNADTQPSFDNSVEPKSHIKDIEIPTDKINVVEDCVNNTPFATTDVTVNGAEPLHDTIKSSAIPELSSHDNIANTNLSHNGKVLIPKNELEVRAKANMEKQTNQGEYDQQNETTIQEEKYNNIPTQDPQPGKVLIPKNELEVRFRANMGKQTYQFEYVQPNETTIQEEKYINIPTQDPQPEEYYQETDNQNPDYVQDPISNYNVENDYIQNESSEHYTEQNQEQYNYTNQQEMYQEEHPTTQTNIEQEHLTTAQEYYDQNSYETPQNETMNSDMAYENVVEPSQEYTPNVYTEDPNSQYAVQDSNESFAVDEYQNETVTEQLYPQGTYDNQHLTQDGEYTQNTSEVVDNSNINEQNIPYDYNQSEQPQHEYDQTNYQQYESNNQQVYEGEYYQDQTYPVTQADIGSVAEVEQGYMPVEQEYTQAEQDTKTLTFLESETDPVQEQNKQDSEFAISAGKPEVDRSENN